MGVSQKSSHHRSRSILRRYVKNRFFHQSCSDQVPLADRDRRIIVLVVSVAVATLSSFLLVHSSVGNFELVLINGVHILLLIGGVFLALRGHRDQGVFVAGVLAFLFNSSWLLYAHYTGSIGMTPFQLDTYFYLQPIYIILVGLFAASLRPLMILGPLALAFSFAIPAIELPRSQYLQALLIVVPVSFGLPLATAYFLNRAHALLEGMISQQNVLLREGHHRIKNNLQLLASLISIRTTDENSQTLKREILSRINAVATLEEQIHQAPFFGEIPLRSFVERLIDGMREMTPDGDDGPRFRLHLDSVTIPIEYGSKIGVFLVELITNAYKHAFTGIDDPVIDLSVRREDEWIVITYSDNGVGMDPEAFAGSDSIGLQLLKQIEDDLEGNLDIESDHGVMVRLSFPVSSPD